MENPLISVIFPIYNVENYLRQCLDSIVFFIRKRTGLSDSVSNQLPKLL